MLVVNVSVFAKEPLEYSITLLRWVGLSASPAGCSKPILRRQCTFCSSALSVRLETPHLEHMEADLVLRGS